MSDLSRILHASEGERLDYQISSCQFVGSEKLNVILYYQFISQKLGTKFQLKSLEFAF